MILHLFVALQEMNQPTATFDRKVGNFWPNWVKCDKSWVRFDSILTRMSLVDIESR